MPKLTFYRQKRFDGGIRTGLEVDGETLLEVFEPGEGERDPLLLWYVDLRCDGPGIPADPVEAPQWLLRNTPVVKKGLSEFAAYLRRAGVDADDCPVQWSNFPESGIDGEMKLVCSASRHEEARGLADILEDIRAHWEDRIESMIAEYAESSPGN